MNGVTKECYLMDVNENTIQRASDLPSSVMFPSQSTLKINNNLFTVGYKQNLQRICFKYNIIQDKWEEGSVIVWTEMSEIILN